MSDDLKNKSVGSLLRQARLAQKGKLPEISENLRINHEHLKALEEDNANGLPGLAYAVGFIRSYATILGWMPKASSRNIKARLQVSVMVLIFQSPKMITNCRVLSLFLACWLSQPLHISFGLS